MPEAGRGRQEAGRGFHEAGKGKTILDDKTYKSYFTAMRLVEITLKAYKQLAKLPADDQAAVRAAIRDLAAWPDCHNVKALVNRNDYRLRVGRFRVIFIVQSDILKVTEVKKRDEHTY